MLVYQGMLPHHVCIKSQYNNYISELLLSFLQGQTIDLQIKYCTKLHAIIVKKANS